MPTLLTIVAIIFIVLIVLAIGFLSLTILSPTLFAGKLSEPIPQSLCINNTQWLVYDCLRNPLTNLGCIIPGSGGVFLTKKQIAVQVSPCLPSPGATGFSGERVISFVWQEVFDQAGPCISSSSSKCCVFNESCTQSVFYQCIATGQPQGENQCLPSFLPVPFPDFTPGTNYSATGPIELQVPCKTNLC